MDAREVFLREFSGLTHLQDGNQTASSKWDALTENQKLAPVYSAIMVASAYIASQYINRKISYTAYYMKCPKCCFSWDDINTTVPSSERCPECKTNTKPYKVEPIE